MNVKQFYQDINGSYESALSIMMVDSLIERMLTKFFNDNCCKEIVAVYQNRDFQRVFVLSHTLKGVAGNLALTPLYEIASIITEATRNNNEPDISNEIKRLDDIYNLMEESFRKNS